MVTKIKELTRELASTSRNINKIVEQLDDVDQPNAEETFDGDAFWKSLIGGCERVSTEATKMCMVFGVDPLPDNVTCKSVCAALETACAFVMSIPDRLPKQQGLTLRRRILSAVRDVLITAINLVDGLQIILRNKEDRRHLKLTGCTWESCERIANLPRDNKTAVSAVIADHTELVKDAQSELQEAIENEDSDNEDDDENEVGKWDDSERKIAGTSTGLLKVVLSCMKKAGEVVSNKDDTDVSPPSELDRIAIAVDAISPAADDFVSNIYPPMNRRAVMESATALAEHLRSLLVSISQSGYLDAAESSPPWMTFLRSAIEHNLTKVGYLAGNSQAG